MSQHHTSKEWAAVTRIMRPRLRALIDSGSAVCIDCHHPILPGQAFAVGHIVAAALGGTDTADNLGPTHHGRGKGRACNQSQGGKLGAKITNAKRKTERRLPNW